VDRRRRAARGNALTVQPIRISRQLQLAYPSVPDTRAVVEGIEMELIWHGCKTVSRTGDEYAFTTPGLVLVPNGGGSVSWLVREGRVRVVSQDELYVDLAFEPVLLFTVPAVLAVLLAILPLTPSWRVGAMLAGAVLWAHAGFSAWRKYRRWIAKGAHEPFYSPRTP
jgi:hypothetical protein